MGITETLNIEAQFRRVSVLIAEGKQLAAVQVLKKLLNEPEAERNATVKLADIYDKAGQTKSAIDLFNKYLKKNSDDDEIVKLVSYFLVRNKLFADAKIFINNFQNIEDENMDYLRGIVNYYTQKFHSSKEVFSNFLSKYKNSELIPSAFFFLAKIHFHDSEYNNALDAIKKSIEYFPNNAESHKLEADIYLQKEMYYHANESIRRALKLNPSVIEWRHFQIKILILLDEIKKAKLKLETISDESDTSAEIFKMIGNWHLKNKDVVEANKYFDIANDIGKKTS